MVEHEYDMVMLNQAAVPQPDVDDVSSVLNISQSPGGWFMEYHPKLRPMDSPTDGIFLAGACQGPKDIPASVAQVLLPQRGRGASCIQMSGRSSRSSPRCGRTAASARRARNAASARGPARTARSTIEVGKAAQVTTAKCHGCGGCVAECPHNAITQLHYTDAQILAQIRALLADKPEEKIFAFRCHWCSYGGADLAGTSHFEYSANERGIRVMCSARMDTDFIYEAFRLGAGAVLYSGCHPQDCHYITGQPVGATRAERLQKIFDKMGMTPGRFRIEWISAAEGEKYARVINEMQQTIDDLGKEKLMEEIETLRPEMEKRARRMYEVPDVNDASIIRTRWSIAMTVEAGERWKITTRPLSLCRTGAGNPRRRACFSVLFLRHMCQQVHDPAKGRTGLQPAPLVAHGDDGYARGSVRKPHHLDVLGMRSVLLGLPAGDPYLRRDRRGQAAGC